MSLFQKISHCFLKYGINQFNHSYKKDSKDGAAADESRSCKSAIFHESTGSIQSEDDCPLLESYTGVKEGIEDSRDCSNNKWLGYSDCRPYILISKIIRSFFPVFLSLAILISTSLSCYPLSDFAYAMTVDDLEDMPVRVPDNTSTNTNTSSNTSNNSNISNTGTSEILNQSTIDQMIVSNTVYVDDGETVNRSPESFDDIKIPVIDPDRDTSNYEDKFTEPYVFKKHTPSDSYSFPIPSDPNDITTYDASYYGNNNYFADFTRLQLQEAIVKMENNISSNPSSGSIQSYYSAAYIYLKNDWNYGIDRTTNAVPILAVIGVITAVSGAVAGVAGAVTGVIDAYNAIQSIVNPPVVEGTEYGQLSSINRKIGLLSNMIANVSSILGTSAMQNYWTNAYLWGYIGATPGRPDVPYIATHSVRAQSWGIIGHLGVIYDTLQDAFYYTNYQGHRVSRIAQIAIYSEQIFNSLKGKDINGNDSTAYWRLYWMDKNIDSLLNAVTGVDVNGRPSNIHWRLFYVDKNIDTIMNTLGAFKDSVFDLFQQQNNLINGVNSKLITVYQYINSTNAKLDTMNTTLTNSKTRLDTIITSLNTSNAKFDGIKGVLDAIETNTRSSDDSGLSFIENINNILKDQLTVVRSTGTITYSNANLLWLIRDMAININDIKQQLSDDLHSIRYSLSPDSGLIFSHDINIIKPSNNWNAVSYLYYIANKLYLIDKNLNTVTVSTKSPASSMSLVDLIYTIAQNVYDISNKIKTLDFDKNVTVDLTNIESILKGDLGGIKVSFDESDLKDILDCLVDSDGNTVLSVLKLVREDVANTSAYAKSSTSILYSILQRIDDLDVGADLSDVLANQTQANEHLNSIGSSNAAAVSALERIEGLFWGDYKEEYNYLAYSATASSKPSMRLYFDGDLVIESAYLLMKLEGSQSTYVSQCQYPVNGSSTSVTVYDGYYLCQATYTLNSSYKASNGWYLVINTNKGQFKTEEFFTTSSQQTLKDERIVSGHYGIYDYLQKILDKKITLDDLSIGEVTIDLTDLMNALQSVQNKQDEINAKLGQLVEGLGDGVSLNTKGIEDKLDAIYRLLLTAGAIENAKDFTDLLIGDLDFANVSGLASDVSALVNQAFPFCIPFLVKEALGMFEATPKAPVFTMELLGAPLTLDFSDASGLGFYLAQFTRWFANISLALILIVGTKRFLFSMKGGGE